MSESRARSSRIWDAKSVDELDIEDEASVRHVELYGRLKSRLAKDGYRFRVPARGRSLSWDRALFLNLTFWSAGEQGDVLTGAHLPADVVMHVAWHHVARAALGPAASTAEGLFLGEAIASAADLYLVGRLLGFAKDSPFLETQVPAMLDVAEANGVAPERFEAELEEVARAPERAFEDLRALLFDAATSLFSCASVDDAAAALDALKERRFAMLLHHYELSNWVLYARAHASSAAREDESASLRVREIDGALRSAPDALAWLETAWLGGLGGPGGGR